jgi:ribosomal protein L11 methyltransferase
MKNFKEFIITAEPFIPEILSGALWQLDINGINEDVNCLKVFADGKSKINSNEISSALQKLIEHKMLINFNVEEYLIEDKNWNEEWEKNTNVIEATERIVIKPTFRNYDKKEGQIIITIDPKMSFGTGEHQTTKLMLKLIEKNIRKNMKVLDVGTGTGVLAIASVLLGASSALGIDNDEWCIQNGTENIQLNNVQKNVEIKLSEIKDVEENDFDIIIANIQKNILMDIADEIKKRVKKSGLILLSGLLLTDEDDIKNKYEKIGLKFLHKEIMDEWIALVFRRAAE